jgi:hypothetical protein
LRTRIAAFEGDTVFVERWLSAQEDLDIDDYKELFFLAQGHHQTETAIFVAEKMHAAFNNKESRDILVNTLMAQKRYEDALPYLRELKSYTAQDKNNYLSVLMDLAKKNPKYNQELASFAATQLHGNVSQSQKQSLIYALLNAGRADLALPYIKEFARTQGGDWVEVYAENLDRLGKNQEARDFRLQLATDPNSSPETRRDIGFLLLDKGYKEDAMTVFANLASGASPQSKDVGQLLYLWGPRLTADQLDWMVGRAVNASSPSERQQWLKYVAAYADAEETVALVERNPQVMGDAAMLDNYLNALYRVGKLEAVQQRINELADKTENTVLLRAYARSANEHSMQRVTQTAYKKLDTLTAGDPEAERNLGLIAYNQADYSETKHYLQRYVDFRDKSERTHHDDYQAYFYLAEAYRHDRQTEKAVPYYKKTLALLSEMTAGRSADMEAKAAQTMVALGSRDAGFKIFEDALVQYPNDDLLRADYVSTLIEQKEYQKATAVKRVFDPNKALATAGGAMNPLLLRVSKLEGYRTFSADKEMLLEFASEADTNHVNLSEVELQQYPWLSYSTQGYDRALLVAKPEYRLRLEPTSGGYRVVPELDTAASAEALKFQKELALRYDTLQARIKLETGEHYQATEDLQKILAENSEQGPLVSYTANAENFVGRWKRALRLLDKAEKIMPENEDVAILKRDIRRIHSPFAKLDYDWVKIGKSTQNLWTASALAFLDDKWEVGAVAQVNDVRAKDVTRVMDGRQGLFKDIAKRAEVFLAHETEDGKRIQGSLFANEEFAGLV